LTSIILNEWPTTTFFRAIFVVIIVISVDVIVLVVVVIVAVLIVVIIARLEEIGLATKMS
jgi:hypothetical protein